MLSSSDLDVAVAPSREKEHPEDAASYTNTPGAPWPAHTRAQSAGQSVAETLASGCSETEMSRTTSTSSQRGQSDVKMQSFRDILLNILKKTFFLGGGLQMEEFANFDFNIWRKRYIQWISHLKSRILDVFRSIDRDQDGRITHKEFVDYVLASSKNKSAHLG